MKEQLKKLYNIWFRFSNRKHAVIGENCIFSPKSRIINRTGRKEAITIKNNVMMHGSLIVEGDGNIALDEYVNIRRNVYIGSTKEVSIGKYTVISDNVSIMDNNNHPISPSKRLNMVMSGWSNNNWSWIHSAAGSVDIGENVWLCQNVRVLKGVTIKDNSIVAASAVVSKNIESNTIYGGNPAKKLKDINEQ